MKAALRALRPLAFSVTDASGHLSLHRDEALANNYAGHVRGALIRHLVDIEDVLRVLEQFDAFDDAPDAGGET